MLGQVSLEEKDLPLDGTLGPIILRVLHTYCPRSGKWKEVLYEQPADGTGGGEESGEVEQRGSVEVW